MPVSRRLRNAFRYWRTHGTRGFVDELKRRLTTPAPVMLQIAEIPQPAAPSPAPAPGSPQPAEAPAPVPSARQLLGAYFVQLPPLGLFTVPRSGSRRISIVTDSIGKGSLMGGVGTALILAAALARRRGARLRLITRNDRGQPAVLDDLFRLYGIALDEEMEFAFANMWAPGVEVDAFPDELFITTSWWTTHATLACVPPQRVLYLLQEDERMFYEGGDKLLRCTQLLANDRMHVAVNTQGLLDHLVATGLPHLARTARAFEPAFPANVYARRPRPTGSKRRFMFYARPKHPRNIFFFGLEVLDRAVAQGILDHEHWDIVLVGTHIPAFTFCDGTPAQRLQDLPWGDYAEFAGGVDLALSLMYTPHPSYPPLDLAASGAVVVTNRFGNKTDLSDRCGNIFMADLSVDSMLETLRAAVARVDDEAARQAHYNARRLPTDWSQTLAPLVQHFGEKTDVWA